MGSAPERSRKRVIMLTLVVFAALASVVVPALAWVLGLVFRVFGWTMRMVFGVLLLPVWIVLGLVGGLGFAASALIPIAIVWFIVSVVLDEA